MAKLNVYFDMNGVLAEHDPSAYLTTPEKPIADAENLETHYFRTCLCDPLMCNLLDELCQLQADQETVLQFVQDVKKGVYDDMPDKEYDTIFDEMKKLDKGSRALHVYGYSQVDPRMHVFMLQTMDKQQWLHERPNPAKLVTTCDGTIPVYNEHVDDVSILIDDQNEHLEKFVTDPRALGRRIPIKYLNSYNSNQSWDGLSIDRSIVTPKNLTDYFNWWLEI